MATITLKTAISRGTTKIAEVALREPRAGELRGLRLMDVAAGDVNALTELLPRITNPALTRDEIKDLSPVDLALLYSGVTDFFDPDSRTA